MFKAKNVMSSDVISVNRQTGVYDAIKIILDNNITGLPVVNHDMTLAGVISEKDVLSLLYNIEDNSGKVEDFMTKDPLCFNEDDSLIDITECLIENNFRRVPIIAQGKPVGIISRKDIIAYILKLRRRGEKSGQKHLASHKG